MVLVAHLSDPHVGAIDFREDLITDTIKKINQLNPDVVVVTGDITENGYYAEFERATGFLDLVEAPMLVVPGNHDARNVGYECFEELIKERYSTLRVRNHEIEVIGLDSSEPDLDYGKVGRSQQRWMEDKLRANNLFKIIALHHHIIPVPKTGRERNVLADAGDILKSVIEGSADLVLSGHKHVPHVWILEGTAFVTAGTFSSLKLRGNDIPSFNTINIQEDSVEIVLNQADGKCRCLANYEKR